MRARLFQFIGLIGLALSQSMLLADPTVGETYGLTLTDVDGHSLTTADGHVTVLVVTSVSDTAKAHTVGDRVPEYCLGNPNYRLITLVVFDSAQLQPTRPILRAVARGRLDAEAKQLQPRYSAKNLSQNARSDVYAVLDFDGTIATRLGITTKPPPFQVMVFGRTGELLARWTEMPTAEQLAAVVK